MTPLEEWLKKRGEKEKPHKRGYSKSQSKVIRQTPIRPWREPMPQMWREKMK